MDKPSGPEKLKKREYLNKLRAGALDNPNPIDYLTTLACEHGDQSVQMSAITGLSKYADDPRAILGIANRLLDSWGVTTIGHVIHILAKLMDRGGLIILSSTVFYDNRFIHDKVMAIRKVLEKCADEQDCRKIDELEKIGNYFQDPSLVNEWMKVIIDLKNPDIREGAIFGSQYEGIFGWQGKALVKRPTAEVSYATSYVNKRIPGLEDIFNENMARKEDDNA